jgi:hypothetical protein
MEPHEFYRFLNTAPAVSPLKAAPLLTPVVLEKEVTASRSILPYVLVGGIVLLVGYYLFNHDEKIDKEK